MIFVPVLQSTATWSCFWTQQQVAVMEHTAARWWGAWVSQSFRDIENRALCYFPLKCLCTFWFTHTAQWDLFPQGASHPIVEASWAQGTLVDTAAKETWVATVTIVSVSSVVFPKIYFFTEPLKVWAKTYSLTVFSDKWNWSCPRWRCHKTLFVYCDCFVYF